MPVLNCPGHLPYAYGSIDGDGGIFCCGNASGAKENSCRGPVCCLNPGKVNNCQGVQVCTNPPMIPIVENVRPYDYISPLSDPSLDPLSQQQIYESLARDEGFSHDNQLLPLDKGLLPLTPTKRQLMIVFGIVLLLFILFVILLFVIVRYA